MKNSTAVDKTRNTSPSASIILVNRALSKGLSASIIEHSAKQYRRYSSLGSTSVPQKVVIIDGIKFSVGGAKQYLNGKKRAYPDAV
jgi:hypothetical protein|tara:strand:- start:49 stop:306 length:258 start_codon:yes stop_codon:yes gene_type:complete